ncbi:MAG TPA: S8 family serine peptidase [Rhodanobacteraceae bacterium]|nr:S8 family serine peptidase [Rhodanobacteraceae bacterium]
MHVLPTRTALAAALAIALGANVADASAATPIAASKPTPDAIATARATPGAMILRAGIFDPTRQRIDAASVGAAAPSSLSRYALVQFQPGRLADQRRALEARGVEFLGYVPNRAFYVRLGHVTLGDLAHDGAVRWAGFVEPAQKLDPTLWTAARIDSTAKQADGRYELVIEGYAGVSSAEIAATIEKEVPGAAVTQRSLRAEASPYVRASVGLASLDTLIRVATGIDNVAFVSPWYPTHTMNSGAIGAIQGNFTGACPGSGPVCGPTPIWDHGIFGSGQIAGIADSGTTPNAAWFTTLDKGAGPHEEVTFTDDPPPVLPNPGSLHPDNKILGYWLQPGGPTNYDYTSGHGTHTTGTILGDAAGTFGATTFLASTPTAANHELADGMAPNAQLLFQDIGPDDPRAVILLDFEGTLEQSYAGGARIHSDSWGAGTSGQYTSDDANVDIATRRHEDLLVVIAAGNDQAGPMATGSPGNSKNGVTVAALGHAGSLVKAGFSNSGPTADGRQKPDISAPGTSTVSARFGTNVDSTPTAPQVITESGTSMATPTIAGNTVLLRQFFADGWYPRGEAHAADALNPLGATMKAVLLNGTNPLATWPSTGTGWGRAWLDGNLWFKSTMPNGDDSRRLRLFDRPNSAGLETGDVNEYTIANVAAGVELRATLAWFDPPAAPGSASTLVNNLDLEVVGPDSTVYLGNHFSAGNSTPGGTADAKDTVEQVRFTAPAAGSYTFRVKATDIPGDGQSGSDRQGYTLAVSGAFGLPDPTAFPAPTGLSVAGNDANGIAIGFGAQPGAQSFQLYRADGTCATAAAGDFHLVASGTGSSLLDDRTQGGYSYAYKVRGVENDVEGDVSACIDVTSQDDCNLLPTFDTTSVTTNANNASCSVSLNWSAAVSSCPAAPNVNYTVLRDTDPYFGNPQTLTTGLATPGYVDVAVVDGTPYYYQIVAADSLGNAAPPSRVANATPAGPDGPDPATFLDDVDTHAYMTMEAPWQITNTASTNGSFSYHNAGDNQTYLAGACASVETPELTLPAGASLSYTAQYDVEYQWDGIVTEISTDGGVSWSDLPPDGGYPSDFAQTQGNGCGFPASQGAFNGVSTVGNPADPGNGVTPAVFLSFGSDLASYAGQSVRIRWRFTSDGGAEFGGFWLDEVRISGGTVGDDIFGDGFDGTTPRGGGINGGDYVCH